MVDLNAIVQTEDKSGSIVNLEVRGTIGGITIYYNNKYIVSIARGDWLRLCAAFIAWENKSE